MAALSPSTGPVHDVPRPFSIPDRFRVFWRLLETGATVTLDGIEFGIVPANESATGRPQLCQVLHRRTPDGEDEAVFVTLTLWFQDVLDLLAALPDSTFVAWAGDAALRRLRTPRLGR